MALSTMMNHKAVAHAVMLNTWVNSSTTAHPNVSAKHKTHSVLQPTAGNIKKINPGT